MLLFYIKIKRGLKEFKIKVKFLPLNKAEKEKILCELFDIIFSQDAQNNKRGVDTMPPNGKMKTEK